MGVGDDHRLRDVAISTSRGNQTQNEQGFYNALRAAMTVQQLAHAHHQALHGVNVEPKGGDAVRKLIQKPPLDD